MNATTQAAMPNVNAEKFTDWVISSQASSKVDEGSTTRKNNLNLIGMVKFPRARVGNLKQWVYTVLFGNDEGKAMPGFAKKFFASKSELTQQYERLGSAQKVADHFAVSKKLILNYMKKLGIARNATCSAETRAVQIELFAKEGWSSAEIAKTLDVSHVYVNKIARDYGIKIVDTFHKGFIVDHSGYILISKPNHPRSNSKGYVREHWIVMEESLGRFLLEGEVVHHIDRNKSNNQLSNLSLMTAYDHKVLHAPKSPTWAWEARRKSSFKVSKDIV